MQEPPQLPEFTAARIVRLGRLDGGLLVSVAGCLGFASALFGDLPGALGSAFAVAAGIMEIRGAALVAKRKNTGLPFLVSAQALLLSTILGYCLWRLQRPDYARLEASVPSFARATAEEAGLSLSELLRLLYPLVYTILALVSVVYQGGMILHYLRARSALAALASPHKSQAPRA